MFKNILAPISGDDLTKSELKEIIKFAKIDQAKITLVYVSDPLGPYMYSDMANQMVISEKAHKKACADYAKHLFEKSKAMMPKELEVETLHIFHPNIEDGVIEAAEQIKADVIMMATHKRKGIKGFFLRGEAHEVILHSKIPVLILNT
jgi:nucleotide-binding universal stress UspA family protein